MKISKQSQQQILSLEIAGVISQDQLDELLKGLSKSVSNFNVESNPTVFGQDTTISLEG